MFAAPSTRERWIFQNLAAGTSSRATEMIHRWDLPGMPRDSKAVAVVVMMIDRGIDDGLLMILLDAVIPVHREWHSSWGSPHLNRRHSASTLPLLVVLHFRCWAK
jgi:hypothetical protein